MNWKEYEKEVFEIIKFIEEHSNPEINVTTKKNVRLVGQYSKRKRQVDIIVEKNINNYTEKTIIDCKFYNQIVDVKHVEMFIGMLEDLSVEHGILITNKGYSKAAIERVYNDPRDIIVDIQSFDEFKAFQSPAAFPYAGKFCVFLISPLGWVIDGRLGPGYIASMYPRGMEISDATKKPEFIYMNIWSKDETADNIEKLIEIQNKAILLKRDSNAKFDIIHKTQAKNKTIVIRKAEVKNYPSVEYTGFIEFDDFIFFLVMFTPENVKERNLIKLKQILNMALPLYRKGF